MGTVVKVVIIGTLLIAIFSLIPPLTVSILEVFDLAFETALVDVMETVYMVLPLGLRQLLIALFSAIVVKIILRWTIGGEK